MCLKQQKQGSVVLKVYKIHEMLGAVNWEIIHWPELRCLFLAGGRRQQSQQFSSLVWRCSATLVQIYKSQDVVQPFGCLWLWARPWQCMWWWKGWVNVPIHIGVRGKSRGSFFETPELVQNDVKGESRCTSFSFIPLTSTSACKQDSFWSSHQQSCTFPEMHSSFRSWVTEDSTWKMCFGLFPFISLMGSWPDMCHFQSFQHWLIKDLYKKVYFCQAHVATLRTVGSRYWQYSHSLLSGSAVW